jgi:hypothetical protein
MRPRGGFRIAGETLEPLAAFDVETYHLSALEQPLAALFWSASTDPASLAALASQAGWLAAARACAPERLADWRAAVREAKLLRLLLDCYDQPKRLKPYIYGSEFIAYWDRTAGAWQPGAQPPAPFWVRYVSGSPPKAAAELLTVRVANLMRGVRIASRIAEPAVTVPVLAPESLLGIIALDVLALATGQRRYQLCAECGHWFDKTDLRADALFHPECSKRRRMREYMRRRRQHQEGNNDE